MARHGDFFGRSTLCAVSSVIAVPQLISLDDSRNLSCLSTFDSCNELHFVRGSPSHCICSADSRPKTAFAIIPETHVSPLVFLFLIHGLSTCRGFSIGVAYSSSKSSFQCGQLPIEFGIDDFTVGFNHNNSSQQLQFSSSKNESNLSRVLLPPLQEGDAVRIVLDRVGGNITFVLLRSDDEYSFSFQDTIFEIDDAAVGVTFTPGSDVSISSQILLPMKNCVGRPIVAESMPFRKVCCGYRISPSEPFQFETKICGRQFGKFNQCSFCQKNEFLNKSETVFSDGGDSPLLYCGADLEVSAESEGESENCVPIM